MQLHAEKAATTLPNSTETASKQENKYCTDKNQNVIILDSSQLIVNILTSDVINDFIVSSSSDIQQA